METIERIVPEQVRVVSGRGSVVASVLRAIAHPPGSHRSAIRADLTALELQTAHGSRWYGFERVWIGSDLRMHVAPVNPRFEEVIAWKAAR